MTPGSLASHSDVLLPRSRTCPLHLLALGHAMPAKPVSTPAVVEVGVQAKVRVEAELEEGVEARW